EVVMHTSPAGIESPCRHGVDVCFARVVGKPGRIKPCCFLCTDNVFDVFADAVLLPDEPQPEHIPLLEHPSAKPHAAEDNGVAPAVYDMVVLCSEEVFCVGTRIARSERDRC